jgi:hypothetical protein
LLAAFLLSLPALQPTSNSFNVRAQRRSAGARGNPEIPKIVREISARYIEVTIR